MRSTRNLRTTSDRQDDLNREINIHSKFLVAPPPIFREGGLPDQDLSHPRNVAVAAEFRKPCRGIEPRPAEYETAIAPSQPQGICFVLIETITDAGTANRLRVPANFCLSAGSPACRSGKLGAQHKKPADDIRSPRQPQP